MNSFRVKTAKVFEQSCKKKNEKKKTNSSDNKNIYFSVDCVLLCFRLEMFKLIPTGAISCYFILYYSDLITLFILLYDSDLITLF